MHAQSTILGTALLVSAAMAAPLPQITTTVSEPVLGWPGATYSNTNVNLQPGDAVPWGSWGGIVTGAGQYDRECSVYRRYRGECSLDQPWNFNGGWGNSYGGNNWYDRAVDTSSQADAPISSSLTIEKRAEAAADSTAATDAAAKTDDASQWSPYGYYPSYPSYSYGWGYPYGGYRPRPYGYRYPSYGGYRYGGWGYPSYYYRAADGAEKDASAESANLEAAPAADAAAATTTVQNTKRQVVGSVSFGGIQPSFTLDNGAAVSPQYYQPGYYNPFGYLPGTSNYLNWYNYYSALRNGGGYTGSWLPPSAFYYPGAGYVYPRPGTGIVGTQSLSGLQGTFSVDSNKKE